MAFEEDGKITWFDGNYSYYEADRLARLGDDALQPHRLKYVRLQTVN